MTIESVLRRALMLVPFLFVPMVSQAIPIVVTFEGPVTQSDDPFDLFGLGVGANTLTGATVTARYFLDTNEIPATDTAPEPEIAQYRDGTDWVLAVTTVHTSTGDLSFSDFTAGVPTGSLDQIYLVDEAIGGTSPDRFLFSSYTISSLFGSGLPIRHIIQSISISNPTVDTVDSFVASTELQDQLGNLACPGVCAIGTLQYFGNLSVGLENSFVDYEIASMTIAGAQTVPLPGTLGLFGAGLAGLALSRRQQIR